MADPWPDRGLAASVQCGSKQSPTLCSHIPTTAIVSYSSNTSQNNLGHYPGPYIFLTSIIYLKYTTQKDLSHSPDLYTFLLWMDGGLSLGLYTISYWRDRGLAAQAPRSDCFADVAAAPRNRDFAMRRVRKSVRSGKQGTSY